MANTHKMTEIVQSIAKAFCHLSIVETLALAAQLQPNDLSSKLCEAIGQELGVVMTAQEVEAARSLSDLSNRIRTLLAKNDSGKTLLDIYLDVERIAREEYHPKIPFHWCARWDDFLNAGNWFTRPEGLDSVEIVLRLEEEYRTPISEDEAASWKTVGQTVRYLWEGKSKGSRALTEPTRDTSRDQDGLATRLKKQLIQRF